MAALLAGLAWADGGSQPQVTNLSLLRDPGGRLALDDLLAPATASRFKPIRNETALGFSSDALWLRFQLDLPRRDRQWLLEVSPPLLDAVTLYTPRADGGYDITATGDQQPFAKRPLANRHFVFALPDNAKASYYLRIRSSSSLQIHLRALDQAGLLASVGIDNALYGVFLGMALLVVCFNLIFWRWLHESIYLAYAGYVALNVLAYGFISGYAQSLLPDWPIALDHLQKMLSIGQFAAASLFLTQLMRAAKLLPRLSRINRLINYTWLVMAILVGGGLLDSVGKLMFPLGMLQTTGLLLTAVWLIWQGRRELLIYLIAFLALYISSLLDSARALRWIGHAGYIDYLPLFASAIHMVLINIGLAQRAQRAEHARRSAEQVTLSMSLHNERELEARVVQRTRALEDANRALHKEVAERTELQAQLRSALATEREAMVAQRQFVAMVSHEFRTPLAIIDATAQRILLQHATEAGTLSGPLNKIRRAVQRLNGLIDTFLGEERQPASGEEVARETLDLYRLAKHCADQHQPLSSGLIDCQRPIEPVSVLGDGALLALVLSSLVDNAIKYSQAGSPITLRIAADAERGWIEVVDYGAGIAPADRERVFDKHVRLGVVAGVGGTGLGLYIARNAARRMQGDIELDSAPGRGSCFRLWLPRSDGQIPEAE